MYIDRTVPSSLQPAEEFHFECGDGWLDLIYRLSRAVSEYGSSHGLDIQATQVKEKYGALRVYVEGGDERVWGLIDLAEDESTTICEVCGKLGRLITAGWHKARCGACD